LVLQGRTREQIRVSVGYNLGAIFLGTTTSSVDATSLIDTRLRGGDDVHNGKWIVSTSGNNDGEITRANDYVQSGTDITVSPAFGAIIPTSMTYEMWEARYAPANIHEFINQAIIEATGRAYDPEEDLSLHGDNRTARLDIPAEFNMLNGVEYRDYVKADLLTSADATWISVAANVTQEVDTEDKKHGGGALKFTIADGFTTGELAHEDITALDISEMTHIEAWVKYSRTLGAGDISIDLYEGATLRQSMDIPALLADTWTFVRITLTSREDKTAIDEVRLVLDSDQGAQTFWVDWIRAVNEDHSTWTRLPSHYWGIDKEARDLILSEAAVREIGHNLIKLRGGDSPALLTTDGATSELHDEYIIARATALAFASVAGKNGPDANQIQRQLQYWTAYAEKKRADLPFRENVREIS